MFISVCSSVSLCMVGFTYMLRKHLWDMCVLYSVYMAIIHTYTDVHTMHTCTYTTHAHTTHAYIPHTCTQTHTTQCTHICSHTCTHITQCTHMHTHMHTHHTYAHTFTHTCTHTTHMHTHAYTHGKKVSILPVECLCSSLGSLHVRHTPHRFSVCIVPLLSPPLPLFVGLA